MLGIREPEHYGTLSFSALLELLQSWAVEYDVQIEQYQSNHEGDLVDKIQEAYFEGADGIVINPGAYTHTSIALLDAVKSTSLPTVEIHISALETREAFRQISFIREACIATVTGEGINGYITAIDYLLEHFGGNNEK